MKRKLKNGDYADIGQPLGVVEEYLPDKNSTYASDGVIYSSRVGTIKIDTNKKQISIKKQNEEQQRNLKVGDIVIGIVFMVRKYSIGVNIYVINNKVKFYSGYLGNVHVSQISKAYVEKIEDAFQKTDIIRAKVSKLNINEVDLSTENLNLGVISADCSRCGTPLIKIKKNILKCPVCENVEKRKLANDYNSVKTRLII
jgi:exosome complex component CSL4